uniref:DUF4283 domain-containing protein n=1 Tax=Ananas comosus var. bracteatus TaxID=296719 RepID=A0A6V7QXD9_ANACO
MRSKAKEKGKKVRKQLVWADEVGGVLAKVVGGIDGGVTTAIAPGAGHDIPGSSNGHLRGHQLFNGHLRGNPQIEWTRQTRMAELLPRKEGLLPSSTLEEEGVGRELGVGAVAVLDSGTGRSSVKLRVETGWAKKCSGLFIDRIGITSAREARYVHRWLAPLARRCSFPSRKSTYGDESCVAMLSSRTFYDPQTSDRIPFPLSKLRWLDGLGGTTTTSRLPDTGRGFCRLPTGVGGRCRSTSERGAVFRRVLASLLSLGRHWNARPHRSGYRAWIRLLNLPFECCTIPRVAAIVGGFGRFVKADAVSRANLDLRAFRCQIVLDSLLDVPQNLSVVLGDEVFAVMVHLEHWERIEEGGRVDPPQPPQDGQEEGGSTIKARRTTTTDTVAKKKSRRPRTRRWKKNRES